MPRTIRASAGDYCHQALIRGNARSQVPHSDADHEAFLRLVAEASSRVPMRILASNHFHLVARPHGDGDLGRWMHWLTNAQVRRRAAVRRTTGHVWHGRFKAFAAQDDDHLVKALCYVERNLLRAGLVDRAEAWPFGSLAMAAGRLSPVTLDPDPAPRDVAWVARVNEPIGEAELAVMRRCVAWGSPYGADDRARRTAESLGLRSSLRPLGRVGRFEVGRPRLLPPRPLNRSTPGSHPGGSDPHLETLRSRPTVAKLVPRGSSSSLCDP